MTKKANDVTVTNRRARLAELIATHYKNQADFVAKSGQSQSETSGMVGGTKAFGEKKARTIESQCGLPAGWLDEPASLEHVVGGMIETEYTVHAQRSGTARSKPAVIEIPQYSDIGGGMGAGVTLRDQPGAIQGWRVTAEWISKNIKSHSGAGNLCIVTGFGNSMQPLYNPGDPLIVDRGVKSVDADATYFFRVGDEGFIKILQRIPGEGIRVISKNKDYETWTIKPGMDFEVFGQVLKAWCGTDV